MPKKRTNQKDKELKMTAKQLQSNILDLFQINPRQRLNARQVIQRLGIGNNKDSVNHALQVLHESGQLVEVGPWLFMLPKWARLSKSNKPVTGSVDMTRSGSAYIKVEGMDNDVYVAAKHLKGALHGDVVEVKLFQPVRRRPEGEVTKIVERATEHFIGTLKKGPRYAYVMPDKSNMPVDIMIRLEDIKGAREEDKVVVKVVEWPDKAQRSPRGIVTLVLGKTGTTDIEMSAILLSSGFALGFTEEVEAEVANIPEAITEVDVAQRRDFRDITTFTIDPWNARDFDDALSYRILENGNIEVGVHIADVTHYVHPGTALDREAYKRSTSVYLVDRVAPMLPERLSNELCSLRPGEDKRTFSAVFTFDKQSKIIDTWLGRTLIHSDRRFTYEEAQEVLETGKGDFAAELKQLNKIALKLRKERFAHGAITFEAEEVQFRLDEQGKPVEVFVKERKDAHLLIEDYMLLANKAVAEFMDKKGKQTGEEIPFVYRVHDEPDPAKLEDFARFAAQFGYKMEMRTPQAVAKSFNKLAEMAREDNRLKMLEPLAIRTMAKAAYSTQNIGHYGLAFEHYTHFTSPIRRYSDVEAHRILEYNLNKTVRVNAADLEERCKHISLQERRANDAERESVKYMQVIYLQERLGQVFDGIISGFVDRGFFVELAESRCEGMVPFGSLDEYYQMEESRLAAKSMRTGKRIHMGMPVKVRVIGTDMARRQIEMEWVS